MEITEEHGQQFVLSQPLLIQFTGSWDVGDTLTWRVDRIGEGTYYANQGNSTGALRFGRGTTKVIVEEVDI